MLDLVYFQQLYWQTKLPILKSSVDSGSDRGLYVGSCNSEACFSSDCCGRMSFPGVFGGSTTVLVVLILAPLTNSCKQSDGKYCILFAHSTYLIIFALLIWVCVLTLGACSLYFIDQASPLLAKMSGSRNDQHGVCRRGVYLPGIKLNFIILGRCIVLIFGKE